MDTLGEVDIAIYWDFENVHASVLDEVRGQGSYRSASYRPQEPIVDVQRVVEYAAGFGRLVIHRAYGNWQWFGRYRDEMQHHALDLVQLFPLSGAKNGADIRLCLDVVEDLQQQPHITHVIVVAGDSDYVGLAQRCRKYGRTFIGIGTQNTSQRFKFACSEFKFYRSLVEDQVVVTSVNAVEDTGMPRQASDAFELVARAIRQLAAHRGDVWALKAAVLPMMKRLDPAFDPIDYGCSSFGGLLLSFGDDLVEREGAYDHELAVGADVNALGEPEKLLATSTVLSQSPAAIIERELNKKKLRLPRRYALWEGPREIIRAFANSSDHTLESFDVLRRIIVPRLQEGCPEITDGDFSRLKTILFRARAFELLGEVGIKLVTLEEVQLLEQQFGVVADYISDPSSEDLAAFVEALGGTNPSADRQEVLEKALFLSIERRKSLDAEL